MWLGGIGLVLLAVVVFRLRAPDEPQYGDKSLTEWLEDLQLSGVLILFDGVGLVIPSATPAQVDAAAAAMQRNQASLDVATANLKRTEPLAQPESRAAPGRDAGGVGEARR